MLDRIQSFCNNNYGALVSGGTVVVCAGYVAIRWLIRRRARKTREGYPRDTVILHDLFRGPFAPSVVPAALKLETYLRMAKIPYQYCPGLQMSSKHKLPWITYNGKEMADSAFIIQFLNQCYELDLSAWLTPEQRGVAVAFQRMLEDNFYWVMLLTRWVHEVGETSGFMKMALGVPKLYFRLFVTPKVRRITWDQGVGRHSPEEVRQIARKDLTALSDYLGQKKFLMGERPCEEDCAVFGQLAQIYWHLPRSVPISAMFQDEFPELVRYCERMKDTFWPDWTQCTTQGGTVPATP